MVKIDVDVVSKVSKVERIDKEKIIRSIKNHNAVVLCSPKGKNTAIGKGLTTKVNVNLGTSSILCDEKEEIKKALFAQRYGADTISDCSTSGDIASLQKAFLSSLDIPLTTVPIYEVIANKQSFEDITDEDILHTIEKHVKSGVSSIVIHAGFTIDSLKYLKKHKRILGVVSKGGALSAAVGLTQDRENPFVTLFNDIIEILRDSRVVLNLGNAMRSGCIHDLKDDVQYQEIIQNETYAKIADESGVGVIIEGLGGHVNAHMLKEWIAEHNKITHNRPLFVSGPLPTEIGVGYDHISAAIGGALAAGCGADYLCAITPSEHLSLPTLDHIREGTIAAKIAAHVGDSLKYGLSNHFEEDKLLSVFRAKKNWKQQFVYALDPEKAESIHPIDQKECSMCGKYCAIAIMEKFLFSKS